MTVWFVPQGRRNHPPESLLVRLPEILERRGAVLTGRHLVYTSGLHGTAYIDMRRVASDARLMGEIGATLGDLGKSYQPDLVVGPLTLGMPLAYFAAQHLGIPVVWIENGQLPPKMTSFADLIPGSRIMIVDDLLTSGYSLREVAELLGSIGGQVVVAAVAVRRSPNVTAADCGAPALEVITDVSGFETFDPEQCKIIGPCSRLVPMTLRPGHGREWLARPGNGLYPVAE